MLFPKRNFTLGEAINLLDTYYPDGLNLDNASCPIDGGDGSASIRWDIIDLKNEKLVKVRDHYTDDPIGGDWEETPYDEVAHGTSTWKQEQTAIEVDELLKIVLASVLKH